MLHPDRTTHTVIIDKPCGHGKTTTMLAALRPNVKYLLVTPSLTEIERFIQDSPEGVEIVTPTGKRGPKLQELAGLLDAGKSVAITHVLFNAMLDLTDKLAGYHLIVDEAPTPIDVVACMDVEVFNETMIDTGYATLDPATHQVMPTDKWRRFERTRVSKTSGEDVVYNKLHDRLYGDAIAGRLHADANGIFVAAVPHQVLLGGASLTIMSFMTEGTYVRAYLDMLSKADPRATYAIDRTETVKWLAEVAELVAVEDLSLPRGVKLSYGKQTGTTSDKICRQIGTALRNLVFRRWHGTPRENILITCARGKWFANHKGTEAGQWAKYSRLFGRGGQGGTQWLPNKTRGTNLYSHASHLIYLYSMSPNPLVMNFLGCNSREFSDAYALAEMVQWIWRSRVRKGETITVAIPCNRMRALLEDWLQGGAAVIHAA